jgi:hypothetical protein
MSQSSDARHDTLDARRGTRFVAVATGPRYVPAAATARGADTVDVDFAAAMVEQATRLNPKPIFNIGSAGSMEKSLTFVMTAVGEKKLGHSHLKTPVR